MHRVIYNCKSWCCLQELFPNLFKNLPKLPNLPISVKIKYVLNLTFLFFYFILNTPTLYLEHFELRWRYFIARLGKLDREKLNWKLISLISLVSVGWIRPNSVLCCGAVIYLFTNSVKHWHHKVLLKPKCYLFISVNIVSNICDPSCTCTTLRKTILLYCSMSFWILLTKNGRKNNKVLYFECCFSTCWLLFYCVKIW